MNPDEFRAVINALGIAAIVERAVTTRRSVERARVRGSVPRDQHGNAMAAAIKELSGSVPTLAPVQGQSATAQRRRALANYCADRDGVETHRSMQAGLMYCVERAKLTKQKRIRQERENAVLVGDLIPKQEVIEQAKTAATELRRGHEAIARAIGFAAGDNRDAVTEDFDHAFTRMQRIAQALSG